MKNRDCVACSNFGVERSSMESPSVSLQSVLLSPFDCAQEYAHGTDLQVELVHVISSQLDRCGDRLAFLGTNRYYHSLRNEKGIHSTLAAAANQLQGGTLVDRLRVLANLERYDDHNSYIIHLYNTSDPAIEIALNHFGSLTAHDVLRLPQCLYRASTADGQRWSDP